jgi:hypothetical protein
VARRPAGDQPPLFATKTPRKGRVEQAVDRAVRAAQADKAIGALDAGLVALARTLARSLDGAAGADDRWVTARLAGELRETLARLRLDPTARGAHRGELAGFLADLARPDPPDPGRTAVGDTS